MHQRRQRQVWKYGEATGNEKWKGLAWGMVPSHASGVAACTYHFFFNAKAVVPLVTLQVLGCSRYELELLPERILLLMDGIVLCFLLVYHEWLKDIVAWQISPRPTESHPFSSFYDAVHFISPC